MNLGEYVWAKQVADKGYYLENGDNMGKIEVTQFGSLDVNSKIGINPNVLPATAGGDMIKLSIPGIEGTRFIFATSKDFMRQAVMRRVLLILLVSN